MQALIYFQCETKETGENTYCSAMIKCVYLTLKWIFMFKVPRKAWVLQWPGQVVVCVSSIYWTEAVSEAIRKGTLQVRFSSVALIRVQCLLIKPLSNHEDDLSGAHYSLFLQYALFSVSLCLESQQGLALLDSLYLQWLCWRK